jgi:hypothetical protein
MYRLLGALLLLVTGACAQSSGPRDPVVTQDVLTYVAKIKKWEPIEVEVLKTIRELRRSQYVDDDYVITTVGGIMDDVELHLEEIARYQPRTAPVIEVHDRYRAAWRGLHDSFATIMRAMERKDYVELAQGTEAMARSRDELVTVAAALNLLLKESGLKENDDQAASS